MFKKLFSTNYLLLAIIIIIASFLRLYNIAQLPPGLYPDEAMNGNNALEAIATGDFKIFYPENNGREGLFINMQALSIYIFGNEPWALRSVSAIFGILTVLGVYFLTKELFPQNRKIAFLAAFLTATSFWHINFSRIGFRAIMAPFFLVWGIYFLLAFLNKTNENKKIKIIIFPILGGIFFGLGFHTYIAYRAMSLLILIIFILYWLYNKERLIRRKILLPACYFLIAAFIIALPIGIYFLQNPQDFFGRTGQISIFNSPTLFKDLGMNILKTAAMFNFSGDWNWRHNYAGKPELFWPVGILFLIGIIVSIRRLFTPLEAECPAACRGDECQIKIANAGFNALRELLTGFTIRTGFTSIILFSWLIIAVLPTVISNEGLPHALRTLLMIPPVFILAGFGGMWIIEKIKNQISNPEAEQARYGTSLKNSSQKLKIFYFLLATFYLLLIIEAYYSYFIQWGKNPNVQGAFAADYVQMGRELNALSKELPKYVIVEAQGVDVRGIPMPSQTIMFITDTFTPKKQKEKNIFYVLSSQTNQIPENSYKVILK